MPQTGTPCLSAVSHSASPSLTKIVAGDDAFTDARPTSRSSGTNAVRIIGP